MGENRHPLAFRRHRDVPQEACPFGAEVPYGRWPTKKTVWPRKPFPHCVLSVPVLLRTHTGTQETLRLAAVACQGPNLTSLLCLKCSNTPSRSGLSSAPHSGEPGETVKSLPYTAHHRVRPNLLAKVSLRKQRRLAPCPRRHLIMMKTNDKANGARSPLAGRTISVAH